MKKSALFLAVLVGLLLLTFSSVQAAQTRASSRGPGLRAHAHQLHGYQVVTKKATVANMGGTSAKCPSGEVVLGGTVSAGTKGVIVNDIPNRGGTRWTGTGYSMTKSKVTLVVSAICARLKTSAGYEVDQILQPGSYCCSAYYSLCPTGKIVVGGGLALKGLPASKLSLLSSEPTGSAGWGVTGLDARGIVFPFDLTVDAICVNAGTLNLKTAFQYFSQSVTHVTLKAKCPKKTKLVGLGIGGINDVLNETFHFGGVLIDPSHTFASVYARNDPPNRNAGQLNVASIAICA